MSNLERIKIMGIVGSVVILLFSTLFFQLGMVLFPFFNQLFYMLFGSLSPLLPFFVVLYFYWTRTFIFYKTSYFEIGLHIALVVLWLCLFIQELREIFDISFLSGGDLGIVTKHFINEVAAYMGQGQDKDLIYANRLSYISLIGLFMYLGYFFKRKFYG